MLPITLANVQSFCRICLRELVFNPCKPDHEVDKENLYELLKNVAGVVPKDHRKMVLYPNRICDSCYIKMIALDLFRQRCIINVGVLKLTLLEDLKESTLSRLKTFCRICLKHTNDKISVDENLELLANIEQCCGVPQSEKSVESRENRLADDSHLPRTLCSKCFSKLKTFMTFRSLAQQSAEYLESLLDDERKIEIKNEAIEHGNLEFVVEELNPINVEKDIQLECTQKTTLASSTDIESNVFDSKLIKTEYCEIEVNDEELVHMDEPFMPSFEMHKLEVNPLSNMLQIEENVLDISDTNIPNTVDERLSETSSLAFGSSKDASSNKSKRRKTTKSKLENTLDKDVKTRTTKKDTKEHLKCTTCDKTFYKQILLDYHIKGAHEGVERPFACELCPSSFRKYSALDRHRTLLHTPKEPMPSEVNVFAQPNANIHVCMTCLRQFKRKDGLEQHIYTVHTDIELRPFKCQFCQKGFGSKSNMMRHEKNHSKERPFACEFCPKRYNTKADFTSHMQRHTTNPELLCPICKRGKSNAEELQKHIAMHEASRQHQCPICGRVFAKLFHLREHENAVHLKLRPFKCIHCDKTFGTRRTQKEHELLHDPTTRPVFCIFCPMNFKNESTLSRHMTREHNQIPKKLRTKQNQEIGAELTY